MRASVYTQGGTALLAKLGAWQVHSPCMAASLLLWLVLFVLARKGIAAQAPLYLPGRVITIAVLAVGALAFVLANAMPNLPLPESLHNLLVFNDDWGTYAAWPGALRLAPGRTAACCARLWHWPRHDAYRRGRLGRRRHDSPHGDVLCRA